MKIKEVNRKDIWESFLRKCKAKTFLNSWNWGEFQKKLGHKIWRFGVYSNEQRATNNEQRTMSRVDSATVGVGSATVGVGSATVGVGSATVNEQLISTILVVKIKAKRGTFLFVPHGPNVAVNNGPRTRASTVRGRQRTTNRKFKILKTLSKKLKEIAEKEDASFIRFSPIWERTKQNKDIYKKLGFKKAPIHVHPEITWKRDLTLTEKDILMDMRKNTRYEIRKAGRTEGLKAVKSNKIEDIELFNRLYEKTAERHDFVPFSLDYLKKEYRVFSPDNQILTFHAKYKGEIASSAVIIFWQDQAFYHHGASTMKYRKIPASQLLQWEIMKTAKARGCKAYNFWGIADMPIEELKKKSHPWKGITIFKRGFGGYREKYVKTQDLSLSPKYWLNYIIETARKYKRGY